MTSRQPPGLLEVTERQRETWLQEGQEYRAKAAAGLVAVIQKLRQQGLEKTLRRPSDGVGWGIDKAIGEWGDETELYDLAFQLEDF